MPGRPRKSVSQLLTQGTYRPDRHGDRSLSPTAPLGQPPKHLSPEQRRCWREVAGSATWLRHPDRGLLEVHSQAAGGAALQFCGNERGAAGAADRRRR